MKPRKEEAEVLTAAAAFQTGQLGGDITLTVNDTPVSLTSLDKIYWPAEGYTKADLLAYYYEVSDYILPYLAQRPLILKRYPNGISKASFYQHDVDEVPSYMRVATLETREGRRIDYALCENLPTLLYLTNLGTIAQHPWHSRLAQLDAPDYIVFDLDPERRDYAIVCKVALALKEMLERFGLESYAKTSGSSGMHVYVPIEARYPYEAAALFADGIAKLCARENPDLIALERAVSDRKAGRVYLDHLQNARGKSVVAAYSVRARPGAPVSAPLEWSELKGKLSPQDFTMRTMSRRLSRKGDLFAPVLGHRQRLESAFTELERISRGRRSHSV